MNHKTEKALQIVIAIALGLLAVPLWPAHRMVVGGIFLALGLVMINIYKKG